MADLKPLPGRPRSVPPPCPRSLPSGLLFGLPVVMDTANDAIKPGARVMLTYKGQEVAVMDVESRWTPNKVGSCVGGVVEQGSQEAGKCMR